LAFGSSQVAFFCCSTHLIELTQTTSVANLYYRYFWAYVCGASQKLVSHFDFWARSGGGSITKTENSKRNGSRANWVGYQAKQPIAAMSVSRLRTPLARHTYLSSERSFGGRESESAAGERKRERQWEWEPPERAGASENRNLRRIGFHVATKLKKVREGMSTEVRHHRLCIFLTYHSFFRKITF